MEEKSANNKALLTLAVKYLVGAAAITCESYAVFFACLHFGWSSGFFWVLGLIITLINAFVLKLRPFVDMKAHVFIKPSGLRVLLIDCQPFHGVVLHPVLD